MEREAVSEGAWWETRGDVGGDSASGDNGTRKSVGGGVADETFGVKIDKQSVEDGVVTTKRKSAEPLRRQTRIKHGQQHIDIVL